MVTRMMKVVLLALVVALAYCPLSSQEDPITYIDSLQPIGRVTVIQSQPNDNPNNLTGARYSILSATARARVDIFGRGMQFSIEELTGGVSGAIKRVAQREGAGGKVRLHTSQNTLREPLR